jgi:hypothetical protein
MSALPKHDEFQEAVCPACQAPLTQCAGRRKKKVQCPKCLQTVILDPIEAPHASAPNAEGLVARELSEIKARLAQLSPLKNRLAEIEHELAQLKSAVVVAEPIGAKTAAAPEAAPEARPLAQKIERLRLRLRGAAASAEGANTNPAAHVDPADLDPRYGFGAPDALHLGPFQDSFRSSRISIIFAEGHPAAQKVGEYLLNRFFYAGWTVAELRGEFLSGSPEGLALAAGDGAISAISVAIHRAFAGANIPLAFQIDPGIRDSGIRLVAGAPPRQGGEEMVAAQALMRDFEKERGGVEAGGG